MNFGSYLAGIIERFGCESVSWTEEVRRNEKFLKRIEKRDRVFLFYFVLCESNFVRCGTEDEEWGHWGQERNGIGGDGENGTC